MTVQITQYAYSLLAYACQMCVFLPNNETNEYCTPFIIIIYYTWDTICDSTIVLCIKPITINIQLLQTKPGKFSARSTNFLDRYTFVFSLSFWLKWVPATLSQKSVVLESSVKPSLGKCLTEEPLSQDNFMLYMYRIILSHCFQYERMVVESRHQQ